VNGLRLTLLSVVAALSLAGNGFAAECEKTQSGTAPPQVASGIRGMVVRWPIKPSTRVGETNSAPMPDIAVRVQPEAGGAEYMQKTDKHGRFEFHLRPGKYGVVPVLREGMRFRTSRQTIEVKKQKFTEVVLT